MTMAVLVRCGYIINKLRNIPGRKNCSGTFSVILNRTDPAYKREFHDCYRDGYYRKTESVIIAKHRYCYLLGAATTIGKLINII